VLEDDFALECLLLDAADKSSDESQGKANVYLLELNELGEPRFPKPMELSEQQGAASLVNKRTLAQDQHDPNYLHSAKIRKIDEISASSVEQKGHGADSNSVPIVPQANENSMNLDVNSTAVTEELGLIENEIHGPPHLISKPAEVSGVDTGNPSGVTPQTRNFCIEPLKETRATSDVNQLISPVVNDKLSYVRPVTNLEDTITMLRKWIREGPLKEETKQDDEPADMLQGMEDVADIVMGDEV
jgi:hypothetical protein